jgi:hypothetical protein
MGMHSIRFLTAAFALALPLAERAAGCAAAAPAETPDGQTRKLWRLETSGLHG